MDLFLGGSFSVTQAVRIFSHTRDWKCFLWSHQVMQYCENMGLDRIARMQRKWKLFVFSSLWSMKCFMALGVRVESLHQQVFDGRVDIK